MGEGREPLGPVVRAGPAVADPTEGKGFVGRVQHGLVDGHPTRAHVAQQVLQHYETLLAENKGQLVHNAWSPNGANQVRQTRLAFSSFRSPGLPPWL